MTLLLSVEDVRVHPPQPGSLFRPVRVLRAVQHGSLCNDGFRSKP